MIRALLKKQLLELGAAFVRSSKTGKRRSRAGVFGYALLFIVLMLLVMLSFGAMALPMALTLVPQGLDWLYFVLMELSALTVSVLASAFTSYGHLFRCRDNQQLLALPIPPGAIFAVRCGGVYLTGLIYLLLAWVPSVVCYALAAPHPGGALLAALPVALALAGVSMVLAVLLGWAVAPFFNDLSREIVSLFVIPLFMRHFRSTAIGITGATAIDCTLPIIQKAGGIEVTPIAISFGFVTNILPPLLLVFFSSIPL